MTQTQLDTKVLFLKEQLICLSGITARLHRQKDPHFISAKHRNRFLINIIKALDEYDISLEALTPIQLRNTIELGVCAVQSCGQCFKEKTKVRYLNPEPPIEEIKYGLLYNWYAATDARNICAAGWSIGTRTQFMVLVNYLGGDSVAGAALKEAGTVHWDNNVDATNSSGFTMRGAGVRFDNGTFDDLKTWGILWTSSLYNNDPEQPQIIQTYSNNDNVVCYETTVGYIEDGYSIRPFRAATVAEQLLADGTACDPYIGNDLKSYPTVKIGTQVWTSCNLVETKYRNGDLIAEVTDNAAWAALTTGALCAYNNDWDNV